jgi:hypothetical protein
MIDPNDVVLVNNPLQKKTSPAVSWYEFQKPIQLKLKTEPHDHTVYIIEFKYVWGFNTDHPVGGNYPSWRGAIGTGTGANCYVPAMQYEFYEGSDDDEYIKDFAYTYENTAELGKASPLQPLYDELENRIRRWKLLSSGGGFADRLEMRLADGAIEITDLRECHKKPRHVLTGLAKEICLLCRAPISRKNLAASLDATPEAIDICLSELASQNLLIGINEEYLTLAIDRGEDGATSCQLAKRNN